MSSVAIVWLYSIATLCIATPLPFDSAQKIEEILSAPEFQPRAETKTFWDSISELLWQKGVEILRYIGESLRNIISGIGLADVKQVQWLFEQISYLLQVSFEFISSVAVVIWYVLYGLTIVGLLLLIGYICYWIARYFSPGNNLYTGLKGHGKVATVESLAELSLDEVASRGDHFLIILILRYRIRSKLKEYYVIDDSMTDKEVLAKISSNDSWKSLYKDIIVCFEKMVFARQEEAISLVPEILEKYRSAHGSRGAYR